MSTYSPAAELTKRLVDLFRANAPLQVLLFPTWSPSTDALDKRVWSAFVELPVIPALREALPRVLVECVENAHDREHDDPAILSSDVTVFIHTVVPKQEEELGDQIDTLLRTLVLSTWLSNTRIIAANLVPEGQRRKERIAAFNDAWEYVSRFSSPSVEVLV